MKKSTIVISGTAAITLIAVVLWAQREPTETAPLEVDIHRRVQQQQPPTAREAATESPSSTAVAQLPDARKIESTSDAAALDEDEFSEDPAKMFRADETGNLVLKEQTRINIEKLSALYTPEERQQRLATIEQTLPPGAYRQLTDLLERYENFTRASRQALPPGREVSTVEEAIAQHDTLHALRVAHFGAEAAEAFYGKEEQIGRQLLDFMSLEQHEGLTMEEKAVKAQEMLMRSPELLAAYERNRTATPTQK